jgi:hypothetical protein
MDSKGKNRMELTHEQRIVAVEQLATDLAAKGWTTKVWTSMSGPNPGVGCEVRAEKDGDVWASLTVTKSGYLSVQKYWDELSKKDIERLCDDATYDGDEPLRPSQQYTKVLDRDAMNGGGRASVLMQRLGFAAGAAAPAAKKPSGPPAKGPPARRGPPVPREPGEDDGEEAPF